MFGCYRRGEANDPDTYVAAVAMVLARYPAEIIKTITDPYSGLPGRKNENGWSGLPDVADVREACEAEAARQARIAAYRALPGPAPRIEGPKQNRANLFVPADNAAYPAMVERAKTADPFDWRRDETRPGIWVVQSWYERERHVGVQAKRQADDLTPVGESIEEVLAGLKPHSEAAE